MVSLDVLRAALTVPSAVIQVEPDGIFARVVAKGDMVEARPIKSGPTPMTAPILHWGLPGGESSSPASTSFVRARR